MLYKSTQLSSFILPNIRREWNIEERTTSIVYIGNVTANINRKIVSPLSKYTSDDP